MAMKKPISKRGRRPQAKDDAPLKVRLVLAAMDVIARDGLAAATTRNVAAEAGLSQAMLHYAYDSKEALLEAVLDCIHRAMADALRQSVSGAHTLAEGLGLMAERFWQAVVENPSQQRMQYELTLHALNTPTLRGFAQRQYQGYVQALAQALQTLTPATMTAKNLESLAGAAVAAMDGLILQYLACGDAEGADRRRHLLVSALQNLYQEPA